MSNRFFKVTIPRRKVVRYEREVWAVDEAHAVAIVNEGTAWPQSYDEVVDEVVDGEPSTTEITDPETLKLWRTEDPDFDWERDHPERDPDGDAWLQRRAVPTAGDGKR